MEANKTEQLKGFGRHGALEAACGAMFPINNCVTVMFYHAKKRAKRVSVVTNRNVHKMSLIRKEKRNFSSIRKSDGLRDPAI